MSTRRSRSRRRRKVVKSPMSAKDVTPTKTPSPVLPLRRNRESAHLALLGCKEEIKRHFATDTRRRFHQSATSTLGNVPVPSYFPAVMWTFCADNLEKPTNKIQQNLPKYKTKRTPSRHSEPSDQVVEFCVRVNIGKDKSVEED